jgi:hypothetical protein
MTTAMFMSTIIVKNNIAFCYMHIENNEENSLK